MFAEEFATKSLELYESLPSNGKPMREEHTVVASIGVSFDEETLQLVSLGTGTKCLGVTSSAADEKGHLLCDCHAEVVARRGLQRYLLKLILAMLTNPEIVGMSCFPLEFDSSKRDFSFVDAATDVRVKQNVSFHLYVSESPCGDASIYGSHFTGAKIVERCSLDFDAKPNPSILIDWKKEPNEQVVGVIRVKSGRSDMKSENKTISKSCSDKICKWQALGLQG